MRNVVLGDGSDKGFVDFERAGQVVFGIHVRLAPRTSSLLK